MPSIWRQYQLYFSQSHFRLSIILSAIACAAAVVANGYAIGYATERASNSVTDIILSNTPVFDVDAIVVYGAAVLVAFIALLLLANPKQIPFTLYNLALFFIIRAVFISLTHIGPFPTHTPIHFTNSIGIFLSNVFVAGDDLFFSAHTGAPFLMALVFWRQTLLRYIFLVWSVFFGAVVLLGHIHYSIDVASAFFISFGIYHLALWLFPQAEHLFQSR